MIDWTDPTRDEVARHHYAYCLEQALVAITECRAIVKDDPVDENHELPTIQRLIHEALEAS